MENINELVSKLKKPDIYSIICGFLFSLKDDPKYSTLCELSYLMDVDSLLNILKYFEGQTVKIPTRAEFKECVQILLLFQYFEIEHKSWKESLELAGFPSSKGKKIKSDLDKLKQVIESYNYGNRNY